MRFEGIHHITCITADAPGNVDFYVRVLGLRLVKKSVNQDDPTVYHLFYADEKGSAGGDLTFFEYPQARRGRAGRGMVHLIVFRVASDEALDFWAERLAVETVDVRREDGRLSFEDPEGLGLQLAVVDTDDEPLVAEHPEIPFELALRGLDGVRAPTQSRAAASSRRNSPSSLGATDDGRSAGIRAGRSTPTTIRRTSLPIPARAQSTTSRGLPRPTSTRHGTRASSPPEPVRRRLSTASTSSRSTSASRAASSSRSRRSAQASPSTSRSRRSARSSRSRPTTSTSGIRSSRC